MAVTTTTRLGIYRWSSATDEFNRTQMDASHAALETSVAKFTVGPIAGRPSAAAATSQSFYLATDQNAPVGILYYSDGSTWQTVNNFAAATGLTPGSTNTAGSASTGARSDHTHSLPSWGIVGELAQVTTSAAEGSTAKFARIDHRHTLGDGSVTAGKIAAGGVSASNQIANGIIQAYHFAPGAIESGAISPDARLPTGMVTAYIATTAPTGWLLCDGASYATASYGALFGLIGYRFGGAGANFNVPNLIDRVARGATAFNDQNLFGLTGGANTVTLSAAQLPSHTHTIDHDHGSVTSGAKSNDHTHTFNHTHGLFTTTSSAAAHTHALDHDHGSVTSGGQSADHTHSGTTASSGTHSHTGTTGNTTPQILQGSSQGGTGGFFAASDKYTIASTAYQNAHSHSFTTADGGSHTHTFSTGVVSAGHTHSVDLPAFVGSTGSSSASHSHDVTVAAFTGSTGTDSTGHTHSVDLPLFSGSSGSVGSGSTVDIRDKYLTFSYIIKT